MFLFDLMDTLVVDPFYREILVFLGMDQAAWQAVKDPRAWVDFELGRIDHARYCASMFADRRAVDPDGLAAAVRAGFRWVDGMPGLLDRLGRDRVHVLSNYPSWWRWLDEIVGVSPRVGRWFVSCETGFRKPDPQAYAGAAAALGVPVGSVVFVDDRARNVSAAAEIGMTAILFEGAARLERELVHRGLVAALGPRGWTPRGG